MSGTAKHFFITGGTGLIGVNLLPRILRAFPGSTITLLVRAQSDAEVVARVNAIAGGIADEGSELTARLRGVRGDVTADRLGLSEQEHDGIVARTTHLVHGAATIRFDHPIDEARLINCGGTRRVLALARHCAAQGRLERFVYIGTSSVSGRRAGNVYEHELEMGQEFFNTYEQSKCESERIVRDAMDAVPTVVFRPSIVIGDSRTGRTSTFNVIYIPLRLLHRGLLGFIPGTLDTRLDLVPVDWVDDVIVSVMQRDASVGKVCHVTAGPARAALLGDVVRRAATHFDRHTPLDEPRKVEFVTREEFARRRALTRGGEEALLSQLDTLLPYIGIDRLFDSAATDALLEKSGIAFPRFEDYAERIFEYCIKSKWGKNTLGP